MKNKNIPEIEAWLDDVYPNVGCELNYSKDYELVIAVMLSAQTTDKSVNKVTEPLFKKYPDLDSLANAELSDIENIIRSIGLCQNKAKNLLGIAKSLVNNFGGVVPSSKEELMQLPGVGNKTASVIRAEIFRIPEIPVDTHVSRIAKRLKLAKPNDEPIEVERKLKKLIDESRWIKTHHQLIHFGRTICFARNPACEKCGLRDYCKERK